MNEVVLIDNINRDDSRSRELLERFVEDNPALCLGTGSVCYEPYYAVERLMESGPYLETLLVLDLYGDSRVFCAAFCDVMPGSNGVRVNIYKASECYENTMLDKAIYGVWSCLKNVLQMEYNYKLRYLYAEVLNEHIGEQREVMAALQFGRIPFYYQPPVLEGGTRTPGRQLFIHPIDYSMEVDKISLRGYFEEIYRNSTPDDAKGFDWMMQQVRMYYPLSQKITLRGVK